MEKWVGRSRDGRFFRYSGIGILVFKVSFVRFFLFSISLM